MIKALIDTVRAYFQAISAIASSGKLFGLCLIPWVGGLLLWISFFIASMYFRDSLALLIFSDTTSWHSTLIEGALIPALFFVTAILAVAGSLVICEFTTDPLITDLFERVGIVNLPYRSPLHQLGNGLARLAIITPLSILCFFLGFIPFIGIFFILISFFIVGFGLIDLPLCIRGDRWGLRVRFVFRHMFTVFFLGAAFALSFVIPGLSLVLLPVGYAAGVYVIHYVDKSPVISTRSTTPVLRR